MSPNFLPSTSTTIFFYFVSFNGYQKCCFEAIFDYQRKAFEGQKKKRNETRIHFDSIETKQLNKELRD